MPHTHIIADLHGCQANLQGAMAAEIEIVDICFRAGATVLASRFHEFPNGAYTGVVLLAESHVSIHTWPEDSYAAVDAFTCGEQACPSKIVNEVAMMLMAREVNRTVLKRGE